MVQYQILPRKLHGLPGTGLKHNLEDKTATTGESPRVFDMSPCWRLGAWLRPDSQGIWHFKVGGGRSPQSGPRLDTRVLRQSALEELTNFARTESPRQGDRNKSDHDGGGMAAAALAMSREIAPSVPRTHAATALRMKQIALDNQDRTIRRLRAHLATEIRGLAATKKELEETQVALGASHKVISGLTEIGLSTSKKIEKMKVKKQQVRANHVEFHQKFQARIHEAEDSMQAQHLLIEALVDEKDSLLQTIHGLQEDNNAPAPFDGEWEEEPEEEEIGDIPLGEGEIDDE
ncbi:FBD-associated F-box protein-like [Dorcoceras hygrometricum]|uniref:FBD-associated F-box protein-like n=1 Tax=Dorcoceras hygrometricum TaxID=472368 RepID=A0A2Z7ANY1_9LAMI|nr:FBD-associated F-box protein-like [Dorcoceras hygrometricum]